MRIGDESTTGMEQQRDGRHRNAIRQGSEVEIILKRDQRSGKTTRGIVSEILTGSSFHPHGIKVRLQDGQVGRVRKIIGPSSDTGD
jgi:uncharacterized repeat protein (TIGR03833 family)